MVSCFRVGVSEPINMLAFEGHMVSVRTPQQRCCSTKLAIDSDAKKWKWLCSNIISLAKQARGQIWSS